jgi:hypothetical protein
MKTKFSYDKELFKSFEKFKLQAKSALRKEDTKETLFNFKERGFHRNLLRPQ